MFTKLAEKIEERPAVVLAEVGSVAIGAAAGLALVNASWVAVAIGAVVASILFEVVKTKLEISREHSANRRYH